MMKGGLTVYRRRFGVLYTATGVLIHGGGSYTWREFLYMAGDSRRSP